MKRMLSIAACLGVMACGTEVRIDPTTSSTVGVGGTGTGGTSPGTGGVDAGPPPPSTPGLPEVPCPPPAWVQTWDGYFIAHAARYGAGGVVLSGWRKGMPDALLSVVALDANGQTLWTYEAKTAIVGVEADVAADDAGNVVLAGAYRDGAEFGVSPQSPLGPSLNRQFVLRLDATGAPVWVVEAAVDDAASQKWGFGYTRVALGAQGHIVVAGGLVGTLDLGTTSIVSAGIRDSFLLELDADGGLISARACGGAAGRQDPWGVGVGPGGAVVLAGTNDGSFDCGDGAPLVADGVDGFVAALDSGGAVSWKQAIGGPDVADASDASTAGDGVHALAVAPDGRIAFTGQLASAVDLGGGPLPFFGRLSSSLAVLDAGGQHLWSRAFAWPESSLTGYGVTFDEMGGLQMTGEIFGPYGAPYFRARFDASGNDICTFTTDPWVRWLVGAPSGWMVGYARGESDFGEGPIGVAGTEVGFLAKLTD